MGNVIGIGAIVLAIIIGGFIPTIGILAFVIGFIIIANS